MQFFRPANVGLVTPSPTGQVMQDVGAGLSNLGSGMAQFGAAQQARDDEMAMLEGSVAQTKSRAALDEEQRKLVENKKYDAATEHTDTFRDRLTAGIPDNASSRVRARLEAEASNQAVELKTRYQAKIRTDRWLTAGETLNNGMQDDIFGKNLSAASIVHNHESNYDSLSASAESPAGREHALGVFRKNMADVYSRDAAIADAALATSDKVEEIQSVITNLQTAKGVLDERDSQRKDGLYGDFSVKYGEKIASLRNRSNQLIEAARHRAIAGVDSALQDASVNSKKFTPDMNNPAHSTLVSVAIGDMKAPEVTAMLRGQGITDPADLRNMTTKWMKSAEDVRAEFLKDPARAAYIPVQNEVEKIMANPKYDGATFSAQMREVARRGATAMHINTDAVLNDDAFAKSFAVRSLDKASPEMLKGFLKQYHVAYGAALEIGAVNPRSVEGQFITGGVMNLRPAGMGTVTQKDADETYRIIRGDAKLDTMVREVTRQGSSFGLTEDDTYKSLATLLAGHVNGLSTLEDDKDKVRVITDAWNTARSIRTSNVTSLPDTALTIDQASPSERDRIRNQFENPSTRAKGPKDSDEPLWNSWSVVGRTLTDATSPATLDRYFGGNIGGSEPIRTNSNWYAFGTSSASDTIQAGYMTYRSPSMNAVWASIDPDGQAALAAFAHKRPKGGPEGTVAPTYYDNASKFLGWKPDTSAWADQPLDHARDSSTAVIAHLMSSTDKGHAQMRWERMGDYMELQVLSSVAATNNPDVHAPVYTALSKPNTDIPACRIPLKRWDEIMTTATYGTIAANAKSSTIQRGLGAMSFKAADLLAGSKGSVESVFPSLTEKLLKSTQNYKDYATGATKDSVITYGGYGYGFGSIHAAPVTIKKFNTVADTGIHDAGDQAMRVIQVIPRIDGKLSPHLVRFGESEKFAKGYGEFIAAAKEYEKATGKRILPADTQEVSTQFGRTKYPSLEPVTE